MRTTRHTLIALALVAAPAVAAAQPGGAPPLPPGEAHATLLHVPVATATAGEVIELDAVVDAAWAEPLLVARYRGAGATAWEEVAFRHSSTGGWFATIPGTAVGAPGTEYYLVGRGPAGERVHFASAQAPHLVRVEPDESDRLAAIDAVRTAGRTETVRLDVDTHDFGNRFGNDDRFLRGELAWTHRVSRTLYAIGFGYGFIEGKTPRPDMNLASAHHAARYGAADGAAAAAPLGLRRRAPVARRLPRRLHARRRRHRHLRQAVALEPGVLRRGPRRPRPDRRGAPAVGHRAGDADGRGDRAHRAAGRADLVEGLYLKYDVTYQLEHGVALRGAISYGSRDGAGNFGGGLGVQSSF
jgi:hypothetical protein